LWLLQELFERGIHDQIAVIILTGRANLKVANYIWTRFDIVDFWDKAEEEQNLLASLHRALEGASYFGLGCVVEFSADLSWATLVTNLGSHLRRISSPVSQNQAETELRHIIRRLYSECKSIRLSPIDPGHSGAAVVQVLPAFRDGSVGAQVVLKYGSMTQIAQEAQRARAIFPYVRGHKLTVLERSALGRHLAAISYSLIGLTERRIRSFGSFYAGANIAGIETILRKLLVDACGLWYEAANRRQLASCSLESLYTEYLNLSREKIQNAFQFKYADKPFEFQFIEFPGIPRKFHHAVARFCNGEAEVITATWECRTHGDLHTGNILVDEVTSDAWLIDFGRTGLGHWARDFAALELSILFQHVPAKDLAALFELHDALFSVGNLNETIHYDREDQPELTKAGQVVSLLRRCAVELSDMTDSRSCLVDYFGALFYISLNYLRFHPLLRQPVRKNQVLLTVALVYENLCRLGAITEAPAR